VKVGHEAGVVFRNARDVSFSQRRQVPTQAAEHETYAAWLSGRTWQHSKPSAYLRWSPRTQPHTSHTRFIYYSFMMLAVKFELAIGPTLVVYWLNRVKQLSLGWSTVAQRGWALMKWTLLSVQILLLPHGHHSIFLQAGCFSWCPTNSVKALKAQKTVKNFLMLPAAKASLNYVT